MTQNPNTEGESFVKRIVSLRRGSMDDKQFKATIEFGLTELLTAERQAAIDTLLGELEKEVVLLKEKNKECPPADEHEEIDERAYDAACSDIQSLINKKQRNHQ